MNERNLRPANVAAAALVIGGVLLLALPGYALGILQLVAVTAAATTALHALASNVPPTGWMSPFKWMSPFAGTPLSEPGPPDVHELEPIRARLGARRLRAVGGPPLPPDALRLLRPLIRSALDLPPGGPVPREAALRLSPLARSILAAELPRDPRWIDTVRPDEDAVAEVVHQVLDELERLDPGPNGEGTPRSPRPHAP
jgi:hypothetical protein